VLFPDGLTADAVHHAVETVLREPRHRDAARGMAAELAAMPSPHEVAEALERRVV
jgi:UDP:flavonoid glycosyltransferase YjiC (YdhE family)